MPTYRPTGRPPERRWQARVQAGRKRISLGMFATEAEAIAAEEAYRKSNGLPDWSKRAPLTYLQRRDERERSEAQTGEA
jgi:hypothetical protein